MNFLYKSFIYILLIFAFFFNINHANIYSAQISKNNKNQKLLHNLTPIKITNYYKSNSSHSLLSPRSNFKNNKSFIRKILLLASFLIILGGVFNFANAQQKVLKNGLKISSFLIQSENLALAKKDIRSMVPDSLQSAISFYYSDWYKGYYVFLDTSKNWQNDIGARYLYQMVNYDNNNQKLVYGVSTKAVSSVYKQGSPLKDMKYTYYLNQPQKTTNNQVMNAARAPKYLKGTDKANMPYDAPVNKEYDGHVVIDPKLEYLYVDSALTHSKEREATVFHELIEMLFRAQGDPYAIAHEEAKKIENTLNDEDVRKSFYPGGAYIIPLDLFKQRETSEDKIGSSA